MAHPITIRESIIDSIHIFAGATAYATGKLKDYDFAHIDNIVKSYGYTTAEELEGARLKDIENILCDLLKPEVAQTIK